MNKVLKLFIMACFFMNIADAMPEKVNITDSMVFVTPKIKRRREIVLRQNHTAQYAVGCYVCGVKFVSQDLYRLHTHTVRHQRKAVLHYH